MAAHAKIELEHLGVDHLGRSVWVEPLDPLTRELFGVLQAARRQEHSAAAQPVSAPETRNPILRRIWRGLFGG